MDTISYLLSGAWTAVQLFALTIVFSLPFALLIAKARMSSRIWISAPVRLYLLIMRGTPLMLQLMVVYFAPAYLIGISYPRFTAAVVAFVINYAAYFAEIYRGGIESIPNGQYEAGAVLGFSGAQTFFRIILPQVVKRILPACSNEFMTLVKDTALAQVIGVAELFRAAQNVSSRQFSIVPLAMAGVIYLVLNTIVEQAFAFSERKLNYYR